MEQHEQPQIVQESVSKQEENKISPEITSEKTEKNYEEQQVNNMSLLSVSQVESSVEKEEKQSSNDGLNSERSYPSSMSNYNGKDKPVENSNVLKRKVKKRERKSSTHYLKGKADLQEKSDNVENENSSDEDNSSESEGSQLQYHANGSNQGSKASLSMIRLFLIICKKEYFFEIIRILMYALISISVFSYVLDQNREKKEFYEAFYSSEQITISKDINGVFPPLFGSKNDIINHTWILESYNSHLLVDNEETNQEESHEELLFEFKLSNVLYIRPNIDNCAEQLKFRWKTFDYNMRIYEVVESDFEKIEDDESKSCFKNKKYMAKKLKEISLWTIDWESKQFYLLTEPFRDEIIDQSGTVSKPERWNELIVLKKQSENI